MSCAQECVKYRTCGVAIYYPQSQICSLYDEDSSLGQISTIGTEESFVLAMNIRQPQSMYVLQFSLINTYVIFSVKAIH